MIPWWSPALALLVALAVLVVPLVLLALQIRGNQHGSAMRSAPVGPAGSPVTGSGHPAPRGASWWLVAGMAAVGAAAVGLALAARRRPAGAAAGNRPIRLAERLAAETSAGAAALSGRGDPRGGDYRLLRRDGKQSRRCGVASPGS